jgi:hypothetical protein
MKPVHYVVALGIILLVSAVGHSSAQSLSGVPTIDSLARFESIPDDLAAHLLNLPGSAVQQPGTISSFLADIFNTVNLQGKLTTGVGISFAPYQLLEGDRLQLPDYVGSEWTRILTNSQIAIATAPALDVDSALDWAVGARVVLLNTGDGRLNTAYIDQLLGKAATIFRKLPLPSVGSSFSPAERELSNQALALAVRINNLTAEQFADSLDAIQSAIGTIRTANPAVADSLTTFLADQKVEAESQALSVARDTILSRDYDPAWNTTSLDLNLGVVFRTLTETVQQSDLDKFQSWVSGGFGFGSSQLLVQAGLYYQFEVSRQFDSVAVTVDTTTGRADTARVSKSFVAQNDSTLFTAALMYRVGTRDVRFGIGGNAIGTDRGTINILAEIRISAKAWIVASVNGQVADGARPLWTPNITVKATGGVFGF